MNSYANNNYPNKKSKEDGSRLYYAYKKTLIDLKNYKGFHSWSKSDFVKKENLIPFAEILYKDLIKKIKI